MGNNMDKALAFTVATPYGYDEDTKKERISFVPCVIFNPPKELIELLTTRGKGLPVELEGRVANSSYEANGERKYKTDVIVRNRTFRIVKH
jgi:single-stranded DNA-binding protein